jgi:hypothetical protein
MAVRVWRWIFFLTLTGPTLYVSTPLSAALGLNVAVPTCVVLVCLNGSVPTSVPVVANSGPVKAPVASSVSWPAYQVGTLPRP